MKAVSIDLDETKVRRQEKHISIPSNEVKYILQEHSQMRDTTACSLGSRHLRQALYILPVGSMISTPSPEHSLPSRRGPYATYER